MFGRLPNPKSRPHHSVRRKRRYSNDGLCASIKLFLNPPFVTSQALTGFRRDETSLFFVRCSNKELKGFLGLASASFAIEYKAVSLGGYRLKGTENGGCLSFNFRIDPGAKIRK